LHDERAASVREAVELHAGEADQARQRFANASANDQSALLAFLATL
jgi:CxxC motif-containing protein (DUF1111 family)